MTEHESLFSAQPPRPWRVETHEQPLTLRDPVTQSIVIRDADGNAVAKVADQALGNLVCASVNACERLSILLDRACPNTRDPIDQNYIAVLRDDWAIIVALVGRFT